MTRSLSQSRWIARATEVFAFLDVLSNHEPFTDHMLVDWSYEGPAAGVGARARLRANLPGPKDWVDMEVVSAKAPETIVEESVGAQGPSADPRHLYACAPLPAGGTDVQFELALPRRSARRAHRAAVPARSGSNGSTPARSRGSARPWRVTRPPPARRRPAGRPRAAPRPEAAPRLKTSPRASASPRRAHPREPRHRPRPPPARAGPGCRSAGPCRQPLEVCRMRMRRAG